MSFELDLRLSNARLRDYKTTIVNEHAEQRNNVCILHLPDMSHQPVLHVESCGSE